MSFNETAVLQIKSGAVFSHGSTQFPRWTAHEAPFLLFSFPFILNLKALH